MGLELPHIYGTTEAFHIGHDSPKHMYQCEIKIGAPFQYGGVFIVASNFIWQHLHMQLNILISVNHNDSPKPSSICNPQQIPSLNLVHITLVIFPGGALY